jgi:hypothetical protein
VKSVSDTNFQVIEIARGGRRAAPDMVSDTRKIGVRHRFPSP